MANRQLEKIGQKYVGIGLGLILLALELIVQAVTPITQANGVHKVLLVDADGAVKVGAPTVEGAKVVCEVKRPLVKGDKVIVFKKKRRNDYRRKNGHRQMFSQIVIKDVIA